MPDPFATEYQDEQDRSEEESRLANLRALAGMGNLSGPPTKGGGGSAARGSAEGAAIGTAILPGPGTAVGSIAGALLGGGGGGSSLSPQEQRTANDIGHDIFGSKFDLSKATGAQWKEITQDAQWREKNRPSSSSSSAPGSVSAIEQEIKAVDASPWTKLGNALASQYQQEETPVAAAVSGATIPAAQQGAAASALSSLGLSPNSSAAQWLNSQTAAAQAQSAPVAQAMAQEGAQYAAEAGPITQAIMAYGEANALSDLTAPASGWLSALSSHITSNLSYYGDIPKAALGSLPPGVAEALKESGGYPGSTGAGTVPLQNINTSGPTSTVGKAAGALGGATGSGVIPGAGISPAA